MSEQAKSDVLFDCPEHTRVGRQVPKRRIIDAAKPGKRVRELLTRQVEKIVWQNKLAPETLNLPATRSVPEIQIFRVFLKQEGSGDGLPEDVLRCIDGAIGFPVLFELIRADEQIRLVAGYKRPSEAKLDKWVIDGYFASNWGPAGKPREALPVALDLGSLYKQILQRLIPLRTQNNENLEKLINRVSRARAKEREIEKTQSMLEREKQFNRKVDVNSRLRKLKEELEQIKRGGGNE
ncbi:DUF4391 domain-containing protein [Alcanivorax sp. NBRC 102024]|jgi:hypothetical protein|uniref:DUF4391 domain-containing protein n=1 Tax=Alcanivorax sp. NBRC 102024 TaxID=1113895 RepID=UPI000789C2B0|nr:DUF4391 domain-containing protein [Alcanivorax sp. NBRC 102024]